MGLPRGLITGKTARLPTDLRIPPIGHDWEALFLQAWQTTGGPAPEREYRFCERRWRFDFAWPAQMLAVEIEGGTWAKGRHTQGKGYAADAEKYNAAAKAGWTVLRYTGQEIRERPVQVCEEVLGTLRKERT